MKLSEMIFISPSLVVRESKKKAPYKKGASNKLLKIIKIKDLN